MGFGSQTTGIAHRMGDAPLFVATNTTRTTSLSPWDFRTEVFCRTKPLSNTSNMKVRNAFSVVELIVVILILGILAAVAAPKLLVTSEAASENKLKQTLASVRAAIELFANDNGGVYPASDKKEDTFKADLAPYLRSAVLTESGKKKKSSETYSFPSNPFGVKPNELNEIKMRDNGDPLSGHIDNKKGWIYDNQTGEFRANNSAISSDGVNSYSDL